MNATAQERGPRECPSCGNATFCFGEVVLVRGCGDLRSLENVKYTHTADCEWVASEHARLSSALAVQS